MAAAYVKALDGFTVRPEPLQPYTSQLSFAEFCHSTFPGFALSSQISESDLQQAAKVINEQARNYLCRTHSSTCTTRRSKYTAAADFAATAAAAAANALDVNSAPAPEPALAGGSLTSVETTLSTQECSDAENMGLDIACSLQGIGF